jgi:hypothetical protein
MSQEEWLAFHANPTIDKLTQAFVKQTFPRLSCGCISATDVLFLHPIPIEKALEIVTRLRQLGFRTTHYNMLCLMVAYDYEHFTRFLDIFRFTPTNEFVWEIPIWLHADDEEVTEWYYTDEEESLIIAVVDRCPTIGPNHRGKPLPDFIVEYLRNRRAARSGAIHAMHAMKKKMGKDVAKMIARVVWSERKYYKDE